MEEHMIVKRREEINRKNFASLLSENVSELCKTFDGASYAFVKLSLGGKGLLSVTEAVWKYPHLRNIELQSNFLTSFQTLIKHQYLLTLNLAKNQIEDVNMLANDEAFPRLEVLNLSGNRIKKLGSVYLRKLKRLNLSHNLIEDISDFDGSKTLEVLELRSNRIKDVSTLSHLPKLRELYLADNRLEQVTGLKLMNELVKLHLRKNKISRFDPLPGLPHLKYINLRENHITKLDQLQPISNTVTILNLIGNPLAEELGDNLRKEVWMQYRQFDRINKQEMTAEDRTDFDREYKERLAEK